MEAFAQMRQVTKPLEYFSGIVRNKKHPLSLSLSLSLSVFRFLSLSLPVRAELISPCRAEYFMNCKTCVKRPLSKIPKIVFNTNYRLLQVKGERSTIHLTSI